MEGERIAPESIRDPRLREAVQRELKEAKRGEAWLITTSLIEAKYPPNTIVIVDTAETAHENDFVMAEIQQGKEKYVVFSKRITPLITTLSRSTV
jgi:hypothetical protein